MLEQILESKKDMAVLGFLLSAPPRSFTLEEISRRVGFSASKTLSIIKRLIKQEYLKTFSKKNKKYYLLNSRNYLLSAVKEHLQKQGRRYNDELFSAIRKLGRIRAAFLSGLFVGEPQLPVDILLVGKVNYNRLKNFLDVTEDLMTQEINYSIMPEEEFKVRRELFDKFIKDIFDYRHIVVVDKIGRKGR